MRVTLKLSRGGINMQEATIAKWHRQPGDAFRKVNGPVSTVEINA